MFEEDIPKNRLKFSKEVVIASLTSIEEKLASFASRHPDSSSRTVYYYANSFLDLILTNKLITEDTLVNFPLILASRNKKRTPPFVIFINKES